uniref:Uncharacterized protein n=1 Tax=Gouania willdenowi TaxID=441366 RepID=A0A8C5DEM5_GOUWI
NGVWRYNLVTHTWQEMSPMQESRALLIVAYMGHIFAVGGRYGFRDLRSAEAYDPVTNTWYDVPEMGHRHSYFDIAVMNRRSLLSLVEEETELLSAMTTLQILGLWYFLA